MRALVAALLLVSSAPVAMAETCDNFDFASSAGYAAAKVVAKGKTHFYNDDKTEQAAYVLPGDEVVVLQREGDRSCAIYVSPKKGDTIGWLPAKALAPVKTSTTWKGKFIRDELGSEAKLKPAKDGAIDVSLLAYWAMSMEMAEQGGLHEGSMGGVAKPQNGVLHLSAQPENGNCEADLRLIGSRYLLVEDNRDRLEDYVLTCAGANVSFTGLYVRPK